MDATRYAVYRRSPPVAALHPSLHPDTLGDAATGGLLLYTAYLVASIVQGAQRTAHADDS